MDIKKVLIIISNYEQTRVLRAQIELHLASFHIKVCHLYVDHATIIDPEPPEKNIDLTIALGGDGTALRAARVCAVDDIPILPIKVGHFGFINEIQVEEWERALHEFLEGKAKIGSYHLMQATVEGKTYVAFNDLTISNASYGPISINIGMEGSLVTRYRADGVIISTPTGSTGHSLSAGGPIVAPGINAFVISPIAPFTLSNRSIVLPIDKALSLEVEKEQRHNVMLILDGRVMLGLLPQCHFIVENSPLKVRIVHSSERNYFDILRDKLGWIGDFRA